MIHVQCTPRAWVLVLTALAFTGPLAAQISTKCPHVRLLGPADADEVHWSHDDEIVSPGKHQKDLLRQGLDLLPPFVCTAVQRVVFVNRADKPNIDGWTKKNDRQDLLYLNAANTNFNEQNLSNPTARRMATPLAIHTIVHESAHIGVRLFNARTKTAPPSFWEERPDADLWRAGALAEVDRMIALTRLDVGFLQEWERVHQSFMPLGWASDYYGGDWKDRRNDDHPKNGFTTAYGGENLHEDIAEMTAAAISAPLFQGVAGVTAQDAACQAMQARTKSGVPPELAAVFVKVGFLNSVGFLDDQTYARCVGKVGFAGSDAGVFTYRDNSLVSDYKGNVQAGIERSSPVHPLIFWMKADGTSNRGVPVKVKLTLDVSPPAMADYSVNATTHGHVEVDDVSFPRGLYFVGHRYRTNSDYMIRKTADDKVVTDVTQAVALVGRSNAELIEGSMFVQRFFNFAGGLMSASAGDEPPSKATLVVFRFDP